MTRDYEMLIDDPFESNDDFRVESKVVDFEILYGIYLLGTCYLRNIIVLSIEDTLIILHFRCVNHLLKN